MVELVSVVRLADRRLAYRGLRLDGPVHEFHQAIDTLTRQDTCFGDIAWTSGEAPTQQPANTCSPDQPCRRHRPRRRAG